MDPEITLIEQPGVTLIESSGLQGPAGATGAAGAAGAAGATGATGATGASGASFSEQTIADVATNWTSGKTVLRQTTALTADRITNLPAASGYSDGSVITYIDRFTGTAAFNRIFARSGSDTINGGTSSVTVRGQARFESNGVSAWTQLDTQFSISVLQDGTDPSKQATFDLSNITTGTTRTINVPNANSTTAQAKAVVASNWLTGMSVQGVFSASQPTFTDLAAHPTTIGGYGITDYNSLGDARWSLLAHTHTFASLTSKPTSVSGYGITDAFPSVLVLHVDGSRTAYQTASDTDAARGTALLAAVAALVTGEAMQLSVGTFNVGSTAIVLPANTTFVGMGRKQTVITGAVSGDTLITPGNSCVVGCMSILNTNSIGTPIGWVSAAAATNVVVKDIYARGNIDGIICSTTAGGGGGSLTVYNSEIDTLATTAVGGASDAVAVTDGSTVVAYGCIITSNGNSLNDARGMSAFAGTITAIGCQITAKNGVSYSYAVNAFANSNAAVVIDGCILTTSGSASLFDLRQNGPASLTVAGSLYGTAKTNGTITQGDPLVSGAAQKASNLSDLASAATARTNLGLAIGTNVQAFDTDLTTWAGITPGTGVGTALAVSVGSAGALVTNGGALGTPSSGVGTNLTGIPESGVTSLVSDLALKAPLASPTFTGTVTIPTGASITTPKIITGLNDTNGNSMLAFSPTASAVDGFTFTNSATAGHVVTMSATGSDTNIDININGKGNGGVNLQSNGSTIATVSSNQGIRFNSAFTVCDISNAIYNIGGMGIAVAANYGFVFAQSNSAPYDTKDAGLHRAGVGGTQSDNGTAGALGYHLSSRLVTAKTANYTVLTADKSTLFTNTGAAGAINFSLPAAVLGNTYTASVEAAQTLTCTANGTDTIRLVGTVSAAGGTIASATIGTTWTLVCTQTGKWVVISHEGSPTVT